MPLSKQDLLSNALVEDIQKGRYQVGDRLPSEAELGVQFGVSRQTVRAALRSLHDLGLIASRKGVGTTVLGTKLSSQYVQAFSSVEDLLQYATSTKVRQIDQSKVVVDADMAARFGCRAGEHWWRVRTVRFEPTGVSVVAYSEIHIPLAFGAVLPESRKGKQPLFALIQSRFGQAITEVRQEISCATSVTDEEADFLRVPKGSPALQITRTFFGPAKRVLVVARALHPGDVFKYSLSVQLKHGGGSVPG